MGSGFNLKININNPNQIIKSHGLDENGRATQFLRDNVYRLSEPYVPRQEGFLNRQVSFPNTHSIKYISPYAHYMYKGKKAIGASKPKGIKRKISSENLHYTGAPKRGPEWNKRMMNDRKKEVCNDLQNFIKNGG